MKPTNKMDGDAFARDLARQIHSRKDNHIIIAQEATDLKDEATQSAQSYWLMGWTWDEIESVLEDSEYPANVVTYAMKETKEYAKKILSEGPFAVLSVGQEIKLTNGSIGLLVEKRPDYIMVDLPEIGIAHIATGQLDIVATEHLREAHALRVRAATMLYKLSTDQLAHISVENQAIDPVLKVVDTALSTMASVQQSFDEVKREAANLHGRWEEDTGKWKPQSKEEHDFAQYTQVTLTGENELDSGITNVFHTKLGGTLASLHDMIRNGAAAPDESVMSFLTATFPSIIDSLEGHIYGIKQRNVKSREYIQQFAKFGKEEGEWKDAAVRFSVASWETTKEFMDKWETKLVPSIESGIQSISEFLMAANTQQITASIHKALNTCGV